MNQFEREALEEYARSGDCVFHGSAQKLSVLEPVQAYNWNGHEQVPDGEPAVFASAEFEIPIFRSICNPRHLAGKEGNFQSRMEDHDEYVVVRANQEMLDEVIDKRGYLYVLAKNDFTLKQGREWITATSVVPVECFETEWSDVSSFELIQ